MKIKTFLLYILLSTTILLFDWGGENTTIVSDKAAVPSTVTIEQDVGSKDAATSGDIAADDSALDNVIISNVAGEIQFDFDEALKNIYVLNKKVTLPKTVAQFGEGFRLDKDPPPLDNQNGSLTAMLYYNETHVGTVFLRNCTLENYDENSEIESVFFRDGIDAAKQQGIYKFRVGDPVTKEDIIAFFGQPTIEQECDLWYEQIKPKERYIAFSILDGHLLQIRISLYNSFEHEGGIVG